jgi:hypothetical protein
MLTTIISESLVFAFSSVSEMNDYKIQVCKPYERGDWKGTYRFMVINPKDHRGYPANYVCMLPQKIYEKGRPLSVFAKKFGDNSIDFAVKLLKEAIVHEKDTLAKSALEKRLKNYTNNPGLNKTNNTTMLSKAIMINL